MMAGEGEASPHLPIMHEVLTGGALRADRIYFELEMQRQICKYMCMSNVCGSLLYNFKFEII